MLTKRVLVASLGVGVAIACAEAQDEPGDSPNTNPARGGKSSGGQGGVAGKLGTAGSSAVSQGAAANAGGAGASGAAGRSGAGGHAGSGGNANAGSANGGGGGRAGAGSGGASGSGNGGMAGTATAGTSSGGSNTAGTGTTGLACADDAAAGAAAGGADGAGGAAGALDLFFDDFESGAASKWTTTLGTWAVVDDGSKAYEQSAQENKLQIAVANGACAADQIIDAKVKVIGFKGQSNSYAAALYGRVLSPTTHYLLALGSDGKLALRKRVNSSSTGATAIGSAVTTTITAGQWYDVRFELIGTSLKGCLGAVCVTGTDSSIASGSVAVGTVNTSARFDDVRLTLP